MTGVSWVSSAAVGAALSPLGLFLLALCLIALWPSRRWSLSGRRRTLLLVLVLVFALICTPRVGKGLLGLLERLAPPAPSDWSKPRVVLVLGGGAVDEGARYSPSLSARRRLNQGLQCLDSAAGSRLMVSGIESPLLAQWLREGGFQEEILLERYSRNTGQNLAASGAMLAQLYPAGKPRPQVWVVSDRYHLFRVSLWARRYLRGFEVQTVAAPSLRNLNGAVKGDWLPSLKGLERSSMAWRELLALVKDWLYLNRGRGNPRSQV